MVAPAFAVKPEINLNGDGVYSFPELQAAMPEMTKGDCIVLDATGDGLLDEDEIAAAPQAGLLSAA
ncbi:hypothetical protein [Yoonia sediminilitoris]|uniref:hypothetical protein n=1 Tax=Yoonia sediminilitoris TaxID=1286148 RepID=UPI000D369BC2|nr:hypothetical protein [Yoonia sediminilitoris]